MKKTLAVLLALVLALGLIPFSFAENAEEDPPKKRYIILALETTSATGFVSGGETIYTASSSLPEVKEAALRFLSDLEASGDENHVSLLTFFATTEQSDFTDRLDDVRDRIGLLRERGSEIDLARVFNKSYDQFEKIDDPEAEKILVVVTTGMADSGSTIGDGPFDKTSPGSEWVYRPSQVPLWEYANGAIYYANRLKNNGVRIYAIGMFQSMEGMPEKGQGVATLFRETVRYLASDEFSYPVETPAQLDEAFDEVAGTINNDGVKPPETFLLGDVDNNGKVESADARLALRASVKLEDYAEGGRAFRAADVNRDGKLGSDDARTILRVSVKLESFA